MSILDRMKVDNHRLTFRRQEDPHGVIADVELKVAHNVSPNFNGFTYEQAYTTEFRAYTTWYANDAQYRIRYDVARKELLYYIYGPVIHRLNEIRARAMDRDYREVLRVVDELQKELLD